jgi:hypothetical protein
MIQELLSLDDCDSLTDMDIIQKATVGLTEETDAAYSSSQTMSLSAIAVLVFDSALSALLRPLVSNWVVGSGCVYLLPQLKELRIKQCDGFKRYSFCKEASCK